MRLSAFAALILCGLLVVIPPAPAQSPSQEPPGQERQPPPPEPTPSPTPQGTTSEPGTPETVPAPQPNPEATAAGPPPVAPRVQLGIDTALLSPGRLRGRRIGLVTHPAGVTREGRPTAEALARTPGITITALFAPEHGLDGARDAGESVPTIPGRTPVFSLYGGAFRPTRQMLARVDMLVVDLQDAGTRPFTYASTMALVMKTASEAHKPVVILDRPNPLGGEVVDGPILETQLRSFIGLYPIPLIHGMTLGELARLYNVAFGINARLYVIPMQGWIRGMTWADTGLTWVNPSPGLTYPEAPFYYAVTGPVDGTNLWNGVATDSRFQVVLAHWIDGPRLAEALNRRGLPGVRFSPSAIPHPRTGRIMQGVRLHVTDPRALRPVTAMVYILAEIRRLYPEQFRFQKPGRSGRSLFDVVWGTKQVRLGLARGDSAAAIVARWEPELQRFRKIREAFLLYR